MSAAEPKFGDLLRNTVAGERNPHRDAYFIRKVYITGRLNPGLWYEMTDGKGDVWRVNPAGLIPLPAAPKPGAGWVSVEERLPVLPEDDDGVKVWTWDGQFVTEDEFLPKYEQPAAPAFGGWMRTGEWFAGDSLNRVTHWMPRVAPQPPKEKP